MFWLKNIFILFAFISMLIELSISHPVYDSTKTEFENLNKATRQSHYLLEEIRIIGNKRTKPQTILREINFEKPQLVTDKDIKYYENRILSLGIFSDVKIFVSKEFEKHVLIILVQEAWYFWPLPFVYFNDRDFKKISYGLNLGIQNLSGRNESLNTGFSLGYNPKFYLSYYNPNFDFDNMLIFYLRTQIQKRMNKSLEAQKVNNQNYYEKYFNFEFGLGRRPNIFNQISASLAYEYIEPDEYFPFRTISTNGIDRAISFQVNYSYDTRDFSAYPKTGSNVSVAYRKTGLGESPVDFNTLTFELKKIQQVTYPIIYLRNYTRHLFGPVLPFYANSYLGYQERLRGYFYDIFESNSMTVTNFELRFPLIEKYLLKFNLPFIPDELVTYNVSLDFHTFFDNAFMFNKNHKLKDLKALNGFGFGFSFLFLPYRSFNFEIAWNQQFKSQLIFDVNFPF